jgi:WXG100 family type VII secretion target
VAGKTTLTEEMIDNAAKAAGGAADEIDGAGKSMVDGMISQAASFQGAAGTAFRDVLQDCKADMDRITNRLRYLANATEQTKGSLLDHDQQGGSTMRKAGAAGGNIRAGLGSTA